MKLTDFKTPTGASGNIFNPSDWIGLILGTVVLFVTFAAGQNIAGKINGKAGGFVDTQIDPIIARPQPATPAAVSRGERVV